MNYSLWASYLAQSPRPWTTDPRVWTRWCGPSCPCLDAGPVSDQSAGQGPVRDYRTVWEPWSADLHCEFLFSIFSYQTPFLWLWVQDFFEMTFSTKRAMKRWKKNKFLDGIFRVFYGGWFWTNILFQILKIVISPKSKQGKQPLSCNFENHKTIQSTKALREFPLTSCIFAVHLDCANYWLHSAQLPSFL